MKISTIARFTLGVLFIGAGFVKITRLSHAIIPEIHEQMARDFGKYLRVAPFKSFFRPTSVQYMHIVGFTEMLAGFMLITNNLVALASLILAVIMAGGAHTHYKLKDPSEKIAVPLVLMVCSLLVLFTGRSHSKEKKD